MAQCAPLPVKGVQQYIMPVAAAGGVNCVRNHRLIATCSSYKTRLYCKSSQRIFRLVVVSIAATVCSPQCLALYEAIMDCSDLPLRSPTQFEKKVLHIFAVKQ